MDFVKRKRLTDLLLKMRSSQIIAIGFFLIIIAGALLLSLPMSSRTGEATSFFDSLFTATSALCITGLAVYDTAQHWSVFGQIIILLLIQTGGIGFMTGATMISFMTGRKITLKERLIMVDTLNEDHIQGIVRLARHVLTVTALAEGIGTLLLSIRFVPSYGIHGLYMAVFTAVSSYCNAGFDIMGLQDGAFASLSAYATDPLVNFTVMGLIIFGGLGFTVVANIYSARKKADLSLQTKIVLMVTAALIVTGTLAVFVFEYKNPYTIGKFTLGEKLMASMFQAVTTRTAGFATFSQSAMTEPAKLVSILLMFVGGSPGSTAGGIKTVTLAVVVLSFFSVMRDKYETNINGRHIRKAIVLKAFAIVSLAAVLTVTAALVISAVDNVAVIDCIYETVSAYSTVGLTADLTTELSGISRGILIVLMYLGRVGSLAVALSIPRSKRSVNIKYPDAKIIVG